MTRTRCKRDHDLTLPDALYPDGRCRACHLLTMAEYDRVRGHRTIIEPHRHAEWAERIWKTMTDHDRILLKHWATW